MALPTGFVVLLVLGMCMSFHGRVVASSEGTQYAVRSRLARLLFASYDKRMMPQSPVNVTVKMAILRIERMDKMTNSLYLSAITAIVWSDNRLVWEPTDFDGIRDLPLQPEYLWTPRVKPNTQIMDEETTMLISMHNGQIFHHKSLRLAVPCTSDLANYPFDSPSCQFEVEDWGYGSLDVVLKIPEGVSAAEFTGTKYNALWEITSFNAVTEVTRYACCPDEFVSIKYKVDLSRKPNGFAVRVLTPAVLTSLLIVFCFLIPPSCGERPVVCSVLLVATLIQSVSFNLSVPMVGEGTPFMCVFFCFSVFVAFFAVVVSVASFNLARGCGVNTNDGEYRTAGSSKTGMLKIARFIDVTCFIVFTFIFAIAGGVILNNHPKH